VSARAAIAETILDVLSVEGRGDDIESSRNMPTLYTCCHSGHFLTG
jgi:hypothetical protein